jgi:transposase
MWTLGIDLACRAAHVASLAGPDGRLVWRGRSFFTRPGDLEKLWRDVGCDPAELVVVMEPTRNAWIPVAAWFRRRGVKVVLVPTTQSADLRAYFSKHTKNDRLDSAILARLPLLHPEGLREHVGEGPADPLRRVVKQRSSIAKRRAAIFHRIDAQLELLGPAWYDALGTDYGKATLQFLARYADPTLLIRLGPARLARFLQRYSRGHWREDKAAELIAAAHESLQLWGGDGIDFAELAADIAVEAEQAMMLTGQLADLDERIANLYADADPAGIIRSAPGVGPVIAGIIAGRLGNPHRFTSLAAIRAYSGLVPKVSQSGTAEHTGGLTKAGDPLLREALFMAAEQARKFDPQLAATYVRLMNADRHYASAICHIATALLTRIATCWRTGQPYQIRDLDGTALTMAEGKKVVRDHHQVDPKTRRKTVTHTYHRATKKGAGREPQESLSAPTSRPATTKPRTPRAA